MFLHQKHQKTISKENNSPVVTGKKTTNKTKKKNK